MNKILNREHMVNENFIKFFNSEKGQDMILNMNEPKNKIFITLHKYFIILITRRKLKNMWSIIKKKEIIYSKNVMN